ncbi:MAG: PAS domain S-box protein [Ignavibacteriales bacterium]|nr:PAS domain S-box protein [Ignavibacteriales bacterium]
MNIELDILRLVDKINDEAFVLDNAGIILYSNSAAKKLFPPSLNLNKFSELFQPESYQQIEKLFDFTDSNNQNIVKEIDIQLFNGITRQVNISISPYNLDGNKLFLIILTSGNGAKSSSIKLRISNKDIVDLINDEVIIKVIEEIKSHFPFTLIGKNNIQNEINRLNEYFWIKNVDGKYLIVNQKFAQSVGLKPAQIEGRFERELIPNYLINLSQSIVEFIANTSSIFIKEGISFPLISSNQTHQVIEFPICDLDNHVIAIIGITQLVSNQVLQPKSRVTELNELVMGNISNPILVLNKEASIIISNQQFLQLFPSLNGTNLIGETYNIFPERIRVIIGEFISGNKNVERIEFEFPESNSLKDFFVFNLRKLYNSVGELEGYLVLVEENFSDALKTIIKDKGKMYELIMQNSPEPMYIYDIENLRFLEVNQAALDLYGYNKTEFLQMDLTDLYSPDDIQTLLDTSVSAVSEPKFTGPWRHKKKNGSAVFVEISKTTFDHKDKKSHFNIVKDVTDKLELEKKVQLYKASFDNTSDLLFVTDPEGFITFANNSVYAFLGYSKSELKNRPFITLASDEDRIKINSEVFSEFLKQPVKLKTVLKKKTGDLIDANLVATPVFDFNKQIISFNILAYPLLGGKDKKISLPDEKRTGEKTTGISASFLSNIFHEILTPMNVILGFVQEITENLSTPTSEQKEAIDIIEQNREVLLQTMDSLMEFSQIEQNKIELNPKKFLFTDVVETIQKNTQRVSKSTNVEFAYGKISSSLNIDTDQHKMESFLTMFVSTAMRITREKKLYLSAYQFDDENYIITIKDNRKGVSEYLVNNLTNIFTSGEDGPKKDFGLSKLKLQLTKRLGELLGGKYETISRGGDFIEIGFIFPLEFKIAEKFEEDIKVEELSGENVISEFEVVEEKEIELIINKKAEIVEPIRKKKSIKEEKVAPLTVEDEPIVEDEPVAEIIQVVDAKPVAEIKPVVEEVKSASSSLSKEKIDLSKLACLYVEDQVDSQILFKVQMKELRQIDFAVSFEAALPFLEQKKYEFIVLDINLQGEYNGLDALRIIRKLPNYQKTKIIAVTAYVLPGDKEKFIAAGFNDFISKPILREKLIDSLEKILTLE